MNEHEKIVEAIASGKLRGFDSLPRKIESLIATVFIFDSLGKALKLYKRDNQYFNTQVQDISRGDSRIDFITKDYILDNKLNPHVYLDLKCIGTANDGNLTLVETSPQNDELIIVMRAFDAQNIFSNVLFKDGLAAQTAFNIGAQVAKDRLTLKGLMIEPNTRSWFELIRDRVSDIEKWPVYIPEFDGQVTSAGFLKLRQGLAILEYDFSELTAEKLWVSTDCIAENSYLENGTLHFFDICHPQKTWRTSDFEFDLIRIGADIYALAGKNAYDNFLLGVKSVTNQGIDKRKELFYRLFACLVMSMYLYARSQNNPTYKPLAEKYFSFTKDFISSIEW